MSLGAAAAITPGARSSEGNEDTCQRQRVLVVDEQELAQAGLRAVLREAPWVESCLVADTPEAALHVSRRHHPQLVLVRLSLEGRSAFDLCQALVQQMPHIKIVLLSDEGRVPTALARSLGAAAALSKNMPMGAFVAMMKRIAEGVRVFPKGTAPASCINLSQREREVLQHLASGLSNPEVAHALSLSRHTIKQHTSAVHRKLGVRNRAEAAVRAQELGLVKWERMGHAATPAGSALAVLSPVRMLNPLPSA